MCHGANGRDKSSFLLLYKLSNVCGKRATIEVHERRQTTSSHFDDCLALVYRYIWNGVYMVLFPSIVLKVWRPGHLERGGLRCAGHC
jgi:hypothetical protein